MIIGIMSAMPEEAHRLASVLKSEKEEVVAGRTFARGTLAGKQVVVVQSRWGKVASAATATTLIDRFGATHIVFTGVAGGVDRTLGIGDIVIGSELVQHDFDASAVPIYRRFEIPLLGVSRFTGDERLVALAEQAAKEYIVSELKQDITPELLSRFSIGVPKVVRGLIASGDQFIASNEKLDELRSLLPGLQCIEMEGAAVAQICYEHKVPFVVIRSLSDKADHSAAIDFPGYLEHIASHYSRGIVMRLLHLL
jgi:adenosylhomocysteine nucleosidase